MILVADTSALFAAFDRAQPEHYRAAALLETETMLISPLVLTELDHLIHRDLGFDATMQVASALNVRLGDGQYRLAELKTPDLRRAHDVREKYAALRLDLADAIGVVLADRHRTDRIFTLNKRDYRAITPLTSGFDSFRIFPADLD